MTGIAIIPTHVSILSKRAHPRIPARLAMTQSKQPPPLSDRQWEIMKIVWDRREVTVGEVWKAISAGRPVARNTILTMVTRLEERGWLRHRVDGNTFRYSAVLPRQAAQSRLIRGLVNTVFEGSTEGLVMTLLEGDLSPGEARRIRAMLDKTVRKGKRKRR